MYTDVFTPVHYGVYTSGPHLVLLVWDDKEPRYAEAFAQGSHSELFDLIHILGMLERQPMWGDISTHPAYTEHAKGGDTPATMEYVAYVRSGGKTVIEDGVAGQGPFDRCPLAEELSNAIAKK